MRITFALFDDSIGVDKFRSLTHANRTPAIIEVVSPIDYDPYKPTQCELYPTITIIKGVTPNDDLWLCQDLHIVKSVKDMWDKFLTFYKKWEYQRDEDSCLTLANNCE